MTPEELLAYLQTKLEYGSLPSWLITALVFILAIYPKFLKPLAVRCFSYIKNLRADKHKMKETLTELTHTLGEQVTIIEKLSRTSANNTKAITHIDGRTLANEINIKHLKESRDIMRDDLKESRVELRDEIKESRAETNSILTNIFGALSNKGHD